MTLAGLNVSLHYLENHILLMRVGVHVWTLYMYKQFFYIIQPSILKQIQHNTMAHSLSQRVVLQLLLIGISSYCLSFSTAVTVHVDADKGSDIDNCVAATTEAIPCKTLQFAVNATKSYQSTTFILLSDLLLQDVINFTSRHNVAVTAYNKEQNSTGQIN